MFRYYIIFNFQGREVFRSQSGRQTHVARWMNKKMLFKIKILSNETLALATLDIVKMKAEMSTIPSKPS